MLKFNYAAKVDFESLTSGQQYINIFITTNRSNI